MNHSKLQMANDPFATARGTDTEILFSAWVSVLICRLPSILRDAR